MLKNLRLVVLFLAACLLSVAVADIHAQDSAIPASPTAGQGTTAVAASADSMQPKAVVASGSSAPADSAKADSAKAQPKFTRKALSSRKPSPLDSIRVNDKVILALHTVPSSERKSPEDVARTVKNCDDLRTSVPPGDWDVFVIAAGYDCIDGVQLIFNLPDDWTIRGLTLNPALRALTIGDLRGQPRPCLIAFDCFAHPDRIAELPKGMGVKYSPAETVVIGRLELTAPSAGSLILVDHSEPAYGPPEVGNCWRDTNDVPPAARGRIDVGQGPGARPCTAGGLLSPRPTAPLARILGEKQPPR